MPVRTGVDDPNWDAFLAQFAVTVPPPGSPADPSCLPSPFCILARLLVSRVPRYNSHAARGGVIGGACCRRASGLDTRVSGPKCVPAPDALTVGQASKLAGDLLAVRLVIQADLPDESVGALADMRAPCCEFVVGC